ncbi:MAG: hypothetical protein FK734_12460 [Asgard group archaeon]|nr:hypothetical protein [Asgard group archaeon]
MKDIGLTKDSEKNIDFQIISKVKLSSNQISNDTISKEDFQLIFLSLNQLPFWNQLRQEIFEIIEERFIKQVIEKGFKKSEHKLIIQDNYSEFSEFFQRKLRYFLTELVKQGKLNHLIDEFNLEIKKEITFNIDNYKKKKQKFSRKDNLIKIINKQLEQIILKKFSYDTAKFLLMENSFLEVFANFIDEFIYYLLVF